jgi:hypothetical protein
MCNVIRFCRCEVLVRLARKGDDHLIELFSVPSGCESAPLGCLLEIPDNDHPLCTLVFKTEEQAERIFNAMHGDSVVEALTMKQAYARGFSLEKMRGWNACVEALAAVKEKDRG